LRRREPGDDLTTHLVQAEENGNRLTNEELTANVILLFGAGHETTVNLIGNGLLALYRHPDQLQVLKDDLSLTSSAIEELYEVRFLGASDRPRGFYRFLLLFALQADSWHIATSQRKWPVSV
jgi:hypothetical protein